MARDRDWLFERAAARVGPVVDKIVADFATTYVGRPVQRQDIVPPRPLPGITWSIDGNVVVEFVHRESDRDQLFVHDIGLMEVLKRQLRNRRLEVAYVKTTSSR